MFADFVTLAMDQICNHAVKFPGMFEGVSVPLVIRTPSGGRRGYGPTHSQSPENLMTGVPGLTVLFPSPRHDSGQLLTRATIDWPYPTRVFRAQAALRRDAGPSRVYRAPADAADPGRDAVSDAQSRGSTKPDLTIVAYGGMVPLSKKSRLN